MAYTEYNGWKNKETWLVNLWLRDRFDMDKEDGIEINADYIQEYVEEMASALMESPDANGFLADLLNCAIGEIDYREIAKYYEEAAA